MKHISGGEGEPHGWLMMSLAVNRHRELDPPTNETSPAAATPAASLGTPPRGHPFDPPGGSKSASPFAPNVAGLEASSSGKVWGAHSNSAGDYVDVRLRAGDNVRRLPFQPTVRV